MIWYDVIWHGMLWYNMIWKYIYTNSLKWENKLGQKQLNINSVIKIMIKIKLKENQEQNYKKNQTEMHKIKKEK